MVESSQRKKGYTAIHLVKRTLQI